MNFELNLTSPLQEMQDKREQKTTQEKNSHKKEISNFS